MGAYLNEDIIRSVDVLALAKEAKEPEISFVKVTLFATFCEGEEGTERQLTLEKTEEGYLLRKGFTSGDAYGAEFDDFIEIRLDEERAAPLFRLLVSEVLKSSAYRREESDFQTDPVVSEYAVAYTDAQNLTTGDHLLTAPMIAVFASLTEIDPLWFDADIAELSLCEKKEVPALKQTKQPDRPPLYVISYPETGRVVAMDIGHVANALNLEWVEGGPHDPAYVLSHAAELFEEYKDVVKRHYDAANPRNLPLDDGDPF